MKVIIPMSGIGKRFVDAGFKVPKPLIEVEGQPIIYHIIDLFPGETEFYFICNDSAFNIGFLNIFYFSVNNRQVGHI